MVVDSYPAVVAIKRSFEVWSFAIIKSNRWRLVGNECGKNGRRKLVVDNCIKNIGKRFSPIMVVGDGSRLLADDS